MTAGARALILALHTGQREGDILRMPWSAYDGKGINIRQGKSRRGRKIGPLIHIPCTTALRRMLDGMDRVSPLILTTKTGQSFKARYFGKLWEEATTKAGLQSVTLPGTMRLLVCTSMTSVEPPSRCCRRQVARLNRSPPSPVIR
jgi:integrase